MTDRVFTVLQCPNITLQRTAGKEKLLKIYCVYKTISHYNRTQICQNKEVHGIEFIYFFFSKICTDILVLYQGETGHRKYCTVYILTKIITEIYTILYVTLINLYAILVHPTI